MQVLVAGVSVLHSSEIIPELHWVSGGHTFCDQFRVIALNNYDGIIGLDWLAKHSPMITHWAQQWISFNWKGQLVVLQGEGAPDSSHTFLELHVIQTHDTDKITEPRADVQTLLDQFATVFEEPSDLPPRRLYDHHIPLIPGARPVSMRPYRVAPALKSEIEQ
jgi:hypothetical protein